MVRAKIRFLDVSQSKNILISEEFNLRASDVLNRIFELNVTDPTFVGDVVLFDTRYKCAKSHIQQNL